MDGGAPDNTDADVHLLVVGERSKPENRIFYPLNLEMKEVRGDGWWGDAPERPRGAHDGLPDALRAALAAKPKLRHAPN